MENNNSESKLNILENKIENEEKESSIQLEDFFQTSLDDLEAFDNRCWNKGNGYKIPHYPLMEKYLEGGESGLYIFAGQSNSGKTAIMMNVLKDMCSCKENKLFGVYYSLDDRKDVIIARIIAMEQQIPIGVANKPQRYKNMLDDIDNENVLLYQEYLDKRQQGINKLKSENNMFKIEDTSKIKNSTDLKEHIKMVQTYIKSIDPEMNVIVAIDAVNDIQLDPTIFGKNKDNKSEDVATYIKDLAVDLDIMVFTSSHLRKLNGNRRPTVEDLRDANTLVYEASMVWLVYNDVSINKNAAKVYWADTQANDNLGAVIELDWVKNKVSSYKGRTFCKFMPYYSLCQEASEQQCTTWENIIYQ